MHAETMDSARRVLAIVLVVTMPPAIAFWLVVHPFAKHWRRVDARLTYTILALFMLGLGVALFGIRARLLGRDLGTSFVLIGLGAVLYLIAVAITVQCRKHLTFKTFAGVPEVSASAFPGRLLEEGIYGVVRHPRYLSVIVGTIGFALVVNYAGAYVLVAACLLGLWPLIIAEERELAARFGPAYEEYRRRVPALIPRLRRK